MTESELQAGVETAELSPEDEITFIVELEFGEDDYTQFHPKVVELDANVNQEQAVQSADSILNLVPTVEKYKGFVDSYRVQYKDEMRASYDATYNTGYVGLSNEFQDVDLKSRIIWWNAAKEDLDSGSLYGADALDITADVEVLKTMIEREGLTKERVFNLIDEDARGNDPQP